MRVRHRAVGDFRVQPWKNGGGTTTELEDCRLLGGPVRDLNLMVDPSRARGSMQVKALERPIEILAGARWELLLGLAGAAEVRAEGKTYRLQAGELLRLDDAQGGTLALRPLEAGSCAVHIAIDLASPTA